MPESGNRYLRVVAGPGEFRLEYTGKATLEPRLEDPGAIVGVPPGQLPFEVYTHLYPSRYIFTRAVTAICASLGKVLAVPEPALGVAGRDGAQR